MKSKRKGMTWQWNFRARAQQQNVEITRAQKPNALIIRAHQHSQLSTLVQSSPSLSSATLHNQNKWKMIYVMFTFSFFFMLVRASQWWGKCQYCDNIEGNCKKNTKITTNYNIITNWHHNLIPNVVVGIWNVYVWWNQILVGLQVCQMKFGSFITQSKYIKEILKIFCMEDSRLVSTPTSTGYKLSRMLILLMWTRHHIDPWL